MNTNLQSNCAAHFNKNHEYKPTLIQKIKYFLFKNTWAQSIKYCPRCGNQQLGEMRSLQLKFCPECHYWFPWKLDKNQKGLL
jgi:NADH pyrophosphatase NudC (nudix superfamily)